MESLPECTRTIYKSRLILDCWTVVRIYIIMACLTTQSVADNVQRRMVLWLLNNELKWCGWSRPWCSWKYYSSICMGDRKATKNFSQNNPNRAGFEPGTSLIPRRNITHGSWPLLLFYALLILISCCGSGSATWAGEGEVSSAETARYTVR